jgi:hypothetical protein
MASSRTLLSALRWARGAVVGGCYLAQKLDAFEEWSRGLTGRGVLGYLDISLSGSGLISGGKLATKLQAAPRRRRWRTSARRLPPCPDPL